MQSNATIIVSDRYIERVPCAVFGTGQVPEVLSVNLRESLDAMISLSLSFFLGKFSRFNRKMKL
jgi:hypothetical protein